MSDENLSPSAAELARLARKTLGHMSEGQHARGLEAVRGHAHRRRAERRRRLLAIGGATAAMAIAAFALAPRVLQRMHAGPPPLALQVESGAIDAAGAIVPRQGDARASRRCASRTEPSSSWAARRAGASARSTATAPRSRSKTAAPTSASCTSRRRAG